MRDAPLVSLAGITKETVNDLLVPKTLARRYHINEQCQKLAIFLTLENDKLDFPDSAHDGTVYQDLKLL
jgi:hypothetical protein